MFDTFNYTNNNIKLTKMIKKQCEISDDSKFV